MLKKPNLPHPKSLSKRRETYQQRIAPLSVYGEGPGEGFKFLNTLPDPSAHKDRCLTIECGP
jgi:hypothetical protein